MKVGLIVAGAVGLGAIATPAAAQFDDMKSGKVVSVQDRPYRLRHEFTASFGVLPTDSYYTGLSIGGAYTLHFNDIFAWEAISVHYSGNVDTNLEGELARRFSVAPEGDPRIEFLTSSHLIFSPTFGKLTFFNDSIIHASTYLSAGGGLARFEDGFRPQGSIGPGLRVFFGDVVSTRLDVRTILAADQPDGLDVLLHVMLSVSFNFGGESRKKAAKVDPRTGFEALDELYPLSDPRRTPDESEDDR